MAAGTGRIVLPCWWVCPHITLPLQSGGAPEWGTMLKSGAGVLEGGHSFLTESPCGTMMRSTKTWLVRQPQPSQHQHNSCERDHRVHFSVDRAAVLTWFHSFPVTFTSSFEWRYSAGVMQNVSNQATHTAANLGGVSHPSPGEISHFMLVVDAQNFTLAVLFIHKYSKIVV